VKEKNIILGSKLVAELDRISMGMKLNAQLDGLVDYQ